MRWSRWLLHIQGVLLLSLYCINSAHAEVQVIDALDRADVSSEQLPQSLEERVARVEKQLSAQNQLGLVEQIDNLQMQVQNLQGQLDEKTHQLNQLLAQQAEQLLALKNAQEAMLAGKANQAEAPLPREEIMEPVNLSNISDVRSSSEQEAAQATAITNEPGTESAQALPAVTLSGDQAADYNTVFGLIKQRNFVAARAGLLQFLQQYPESSYAANVHYWLGELYFAENDYKPALAAFNKVVQDFPQSPKVADAMLKQGYIYYEMGQWQQVRSTLTSLKQRYPSSPSAYLAGQRLQQMNTQGL